MIDPKDLNLKIVKKTGTFKIDLPEGTTNVILSVSKTDGSFIPLTVELIQHITVARIEELLKDGNVSQITLIPINFNEYIHVLKEWRPLKCQETLKEFQES